MAPGGARKRTHALLPFEDDGLTDDQRIAALKLEVARLEAAVRAALYLEKFWRVRALLGSMPDRPDADEVTP